jgi:Ca2+-binding RTX toxin-like protein
LEAAEPDLQSVFKRPGGAGDYLLIGGPGQDVLDGGPGHDHLVQD